MADVKVTNADPVWQAWIDCDGCSLGHDANPAEAGMHALAHARKLLQPERERAALERKVRRVLEKQLRYDYDMEGTEIPEETQAALAAAEALDKEQP